MHAWNVTPQQAIEVQKQLRDRVRLIPLTIEVRTVAGCDISMNLRSPTAYAGFIALSFPDLDPITHAVVQDTLSFPYIPGLLSFREIPSLLKAWEKLSVKPDVVIVDGIGIAHPRRLGIASHLGLLLDIPTIGCAKSVLTGIYKEPGLEAGSLSYLYDRHDNTEIIGAALRTKYNVKPVFISPGHKITLEEAIAIVQKCVRGYRIPEPTRRAHVLVNEYRRGTNLLTTPG